MKKEQNLKIYDLTSKIRDLLHEPRKQYELLQDSNKWSQLWGCVNTINDISIMLEEYLSVNKFDTSNNGRIILYGILQGLYIQQNALENLLWAVSADVKKSKKDRKINWKIDYPEVFKIREIRDSYAGHPTFDGKGYYDIHPDYIKPDGFSVWAYLKDGSFKNEYINLKKLVEQQNIAVFSILKQLIKDIEDSEMKHKQKFQNESLYEILKGVDYGFEKLYEPIYNESNNYLEWSKATFEAIKVMYQKFIDEIEKRYGSIEAINSIEYLKIKIDWDIEKIDNLFVTSNFYSNKEATVYSDHIKYLFDKLKEIAKEIDEEYNGNK